MIFYRSITDQFGHDADAYVTAYTGLTADRSALFAAVVPLTGARWSPHGLTRPDEAAVPAVELLP